MTASPQEKQYHSVGIFDNRTNQKLIIYLELYCEEIHLSPNHEIELFISGDDSCYFPMSFVYHPNAIQIYPNDNVIHPYDWYFKFNGKIYEAGYPTILSELE